MGHPLNETFDLPETESIEDLKRIFGEEVKIPDDPNLKTIVELALKQYKELITSASLMEPSDRAKMIDQAKEFLDLAKDAMHKESDLEIKYNKAIQGKIKNKKNNALPDDNERTIERKELCREDN